MKSGLEMSLYLQVSCLISGLSKNKHSLLWWLHASFKSPYKASSSSTLSTMVESHLMYLTTKDLVDCMLGLHFIETKWIGTKSLLFLKIILGPCIKSVNSWCTMGLCIMHSSLRSSCIMLHEPTEIHALAYTYFCDPKHFVNFFFRKFEHLANH